jgi:hypothetical protein
MTMDTRAAMVIAEYRRQRESLLVEFPELAEDEDALSDTLDGLTEAQDLVARHVRAARHDKANVAALAGIINEDRERKARLERRAEKHLEIATALMEAMGERKIERPDFTASVRALPPKVQILDETALPDGAWRIVEKREPDKAEIKRLLETGQEVPGACLSNGGTGLTVRVR